MIKSSGNFVDIEKNKQTKKFVSITRGKYFEPKIIKSEMI